MFLTYIVNNLKVGLAGSSHVYMRFIMLIQMAVFKSRCEGDVIE